MHRVGFDLGRIPLRVGDYGSTITAGARPVTNAGPVQPTGLRPCSPTSGGGTRSWFFLHLSPTAIPRIAGTSGTGHPDVVIDGDQVCIARTGMRWSAKEPAHRSRFSVATNANLSLGKSRLD